MLKQIAKPAIVIGLTAMLLTTLAGGSAVFAQGSGADNPTHSGEFWGAIFIDTAAGAVIDSLSADSAAAAAGLLKDDVITGVNGSPVNTAHPLQEHIHASAPGKTLTLDVLRGGDSLEITVTLPLDETAVKQAADEQTAISRHIIDQLIPENPAQEFNSSLGALLDRLTDATKSPNDYSVKTTPENQALSNLTDLANRLADRTATLEMLWEKIVAQAQ